MTRPRKPNHVAEAASDAPSPNFAAWAHSLIESTRSTARLSDDDLFVLRNQVEELSTAVDPAGADSSLPVIVHNASQLTTIADRLTASDAVALDIETHGLDPLKGEIVGIGLAIAEQAWYLPVSHRLEAGPLRPRQLTLEAIGKALPLGQLRLVAHNAKYERGWLRRHMGVELAFHWDTMLAAKLQASHLSADLKAVAVRLLDVPAWSLRKDELTQMRFLPIERVARYCAKDCLYTLQIYRQQIASNAVPEYIMQHVELPCISVVSDMEDAGYLIDAEHFNEIRETLEPPRAELLQHIRCQAGANFNPRSSQQMVALLDRLEVPITRRTKSGQRATDSDALKAASAQHHVFANILRLRDFDKILGTYATIPTKVSDDGRLRVDFNQLAARTGRFSSSSVIQTLPRAENDEHGIRRGFIASPGFTIVAADFNQQELRVLAQVSGDKNMQDAIVAGVDLHGLAAVKVFGLHCNPNEVKNQQPEKRSQVKAIQFGLLYGRGAIGLARKLGISNDEAEVLVSTYFEQYPRVRRFITNVHSLLTRNKFVEDVFGRRRYFPDMPRAPQIRHGTPLSASQRATFSEIRTAKREAQNFVIQGASATITKLAMIRTHTHIKADHPDIRMIVTLHDELQFEVPDALVDHFAAELPDLMCNIGLERFDFTVPMQVEIKTGTSWGTLQPWEGPQNVQDTPH